MLIFDLEYQIKYQRNATWLHCAAEHVALVSRPNSGGKTGAINKVPVLFNLKAFAVHNKCCPKVWSSIG